MSAIERIAFHLGRRDEVPNQELARDLAGRGDVDGIAEIAAHLDDRNKNVASDCLKVLYEVGYIDPALIAPYVDTFIDLLSSGNNRMVWGGMIALWTVADLRHDDIWERIDEVRKAVEGGTVITVVSGVKALSLVASKDPVREERLRPFLFGILSDCPAKLLPTHAEDMLVMVGDGNRDAMVGLLEGRADELSRSQRTRLNRVLRTLGDV